MPNLVECILENDPQLKKVVIENCISEREAVVALLQNTQVEEIAIFCFDPNLIVEDEVEKKNKNTILKVLSSNERKLNKNNSKNVSCISKLSKVEIRFDGKAAEVHQFIMAAAQNPNHLHVCLNGCKYKAESVLYALGNQSLLSGLEISDADLVKDDESKHEFHSSQDIVDYLEKHEHGLGKHLEKLVLDPKVKNDPHDFCNLLAEALLLLSNRHDSSNNKASHMGLKHLTMSSGIHFSEALTKNKTLESLHIINHDSIDSNDVKLLLAHIQSNPNLVELKLQDSYFMPSSTNETKANASLRCFQTILKTLTQPGCAVRKLSLNDPKRLAGSESLDERWYMDVLALALPSLHALDELEIGPWTTNNATYIAICQRKLQMGMSQNYGIRRVNWPNGEEIVLQIGNGLAGGGPKINNTGTIGCASLGDHAQITNGPSATFGLIKAGNGRRFIHSPNPQNIGMILLDSAIPYGITKRLVCPENEIIQDITARNRQIHSMLEDDDQFEALPPTQIMRILQLGSMSNRGRIAAMYRIATMQNTTTVGEKSGSTTTTSCEGAMATLAEKEQGEEPATENKENHDKSLTDTKQ